jgi:hypothetical protein
LGVELENVSMNVPGGKSKEVSTPMSSESVKAISTILASISICGTPAPNRLMKLSTSSSSEKPVVTTSQSASATSIGCAPMFGSRRSV